MKILLAEYDSVREGQLTSILTEAGYDVVGAADDNAAMGYLQGADSPDLAIVNSEFSILVQIQEVPAPPYLILLTSEVECTPEVDDYLVMPVDPRHLLARVSVGRRIVALQQRLKALAASEETDDTESREKYKGLVRMLDSLDAVVYAADMQTHEMLFMNAAARSIAGGDIGQKCWQVMQAGQTGPCPFCTNDKLLDAKGDPTTPYVWEFQNTVNKNWYQCRDQAIRWQDGRLVRLEVATNITDRIQAEEALRQSETDLQIITDASFEAIFLSDKGICLGQNLTAQQMFGYTQEEAVGKSGTEWVVPEDREQVMNKMLSEYEQPYEVTALRKDGTTFPAEIQGRMIPHQGERIRMTALRDLSDRKRAEEALRQSEEDLQNVSDASFDAIFLLDKGYCLNQNLTAEKMFGYSLEEAVGRSNAELVVPEDREQVIKHMLEDYELPYEVTALRKDGTTFPAEVQGRMITYRNKPVRMATVRDTSMRKQAEEVVREQEERFRAFFSSVNDAILVHPLQKQGFGPFIEVNDTACKRYGYSHEEFMHMTIEDLNEKMVIEPDETGSIRKKLEEEKRLVLESVHVKKSGEKFPVEINATVVNLGKKPIILSVIRDISERKQAEKGAREQEERFKAFFSSVNDAIFVHPLQKEGFAPFVEVNNTACRHYGYTREEFLQMTAQDITKKMVIEQHATGRHRQNLLEAKKMVFEAIHIKKSGEEFPVEISANIVEEHGNPIIIAVVRDITERKKAERQIEHMAFYDALTDLPNRALFVEQLRIALQNYQRDKEPFAVHMLDLDHFKDVNDSLGHPVGDLLLKAVAERIKTVVRSSDIFARLGGDEFVLMQSQYHDLTDVANLAEKIIAEISRDFEIDGHKIWINVSIGIVINDKPGIMVDEMLSQVDSALYKAKEAGRGTYAYYEDAMTLSLQRELRLSRELSTAVTLQELIVEYQPQVNLDNGQLVGMEALMRWRHPQRGKLYPGDFLAIAEKRGLIRELSNWVMREACRQSREWQQQGVEFGRIAINLSAQQLTHKNFEEDVLDILAATAVDPKTVEFEFTETVLIDATEQIMSSISRLSGFGITFAIDDFGTGFSSLSYLKKFATDKIKIDREFVKDILVDPGDEKIVSATIALGNTLGLVTIAEGVETAEQAALLKAHGCGMAQGYHYGRAMAADEIERQWLK